MSDTIKFKAGQILLTGKNSLISKGIRAADGCDVSHAATVYDDKTVVDARGDFPNGSVSRRSLNVLIEESDTVYLLTPVLDLRYGYLCDARGMQKYLTSQIGKKYDYFNTLFMQVRRILGFGKLFQRKQERAAKRWQCAELAVSAAKKTYGFFPDWPKKLAASPCMLKYSDHYTVQRLK